MSVLWACPVCEAANAPRAKVCEHCGHERAVLRLEAPALETCARCGDDSKNTTAFPEDGAPEDRGVRLCPFCWMCAVKRRAERDPASDTERAVLRRQLYADLNRIEARNAVAKRQPPTEVRL